MRNIFSTISFFISKIFYSFIWRRAIKENKKPEVGSNQKDFPDIVSYVKQSTDIFSILFCIFFIILINVSYFVLRVILKNR